MSSDDKKSGDFTEESLEEEFEDNYYAILNVNKDATTEEITNSYRKMSRMYHPDKHFTKESKASAEILFAKTKRAYEILSDPQKRAIYDTVGIKGLEIDMNSDSSSALIPRYRTAQEIREEYERQMREREERNIERKTNAKGVMTVDINACEIFNRYEDEFVNPPILELTAFHFSQAVDTPLTNADTLLLNGSVSAENGRGSGTINAGLRKTLGQMSLGEVELGGSQDGINFGVKGGTHFGRNYFSNFNGLISSEGRLACATSLGHQISSNSVGMLTWRWGGALNSLQCSYTRNGSMSRFVASLHLGTPHCFALVSYTHNLEARGEKYRGAMKAGTFGAYVEYGVEKKISDLSTVSATMLVGMPMGVTLKLKVRRHQQSYVFPIHLAEEILPAAIFYGSITPFILYVITKKLFLDPYEQEKKRIEKEKLKQTYKHRLAEKKSEAEAAINLMQETYNRICAEEQSRNGLIITQGLYGHIVSTEGSDGPNTEMNANNEVIVVTIPLQCLVKDSKLIIHNGSKSQLPDFYDPAPGEDKNLLIRYQFQGKQHECVCKDSDGIKIPKMSHKID